MYTEMLAVLDTAKNERDISPFLKSNIVLIRNTMNVHAWNHVTCKPEFSFGDDYKADFIIVSADSGCWHVVLIEVQSHNDKIYNKNGNMSRELNEAQRQIQDWAIWIGHNDGLFRDKIANLVGGTHAHCSNAAEHTKAATEIRDPRTVIDVNYKVLIGRREFLSSANNERRNRHNFEIVTFDRLLDYAKMLDTGERFDLPVNLWPY